jgi:HPt (histidine-containing phosphotransfer) domain-containing protein
MEPLKLMSDARQDAAQAAQTTEQILDLQQVQELRDVLEDEFSSVIEAYLRDAERKVETVVAAAGEQDAEALRMAAHSLKGSCRNVGARQLAESCQIIESLAYEDRLDNVPVALVALRHTLVATRSAFLGCA